MNLSQLPANEQQEHETIAVCKEENTKKFSLEEISLELSYKQSLKHWTIQNLMIHWLMTLQLRKLFRELFKEISQNEIITPTDKKQLLSKILQQRINHFWQNYQKLEVLKNIQNIKKCKQRGKASRKCVALSFTARENNKITKKDPSG